MHIGRTITSVQTPIIPVIGEWTRNTPGTLSLGQGMVSYPPPAAALQAIRDFGTQTGRTFIRFTAWVWTPTGID